MWIRRFAATSIAFRRAHRLGHGAGGLEVALAGDGEPGLDDVDPEAGELLGDLHLLADVEADPGGLLAVAEGGVEDDHLLCRLIAHRVRSLWSLLIWS